MKVITKLVIMPVIVLLFVLLSATLSFSQEIAIFEEFFEGYEKKWEIKSDQLDINRIFIGVGNEHFDIFTINGDERIYRHYNNSGKQVWTTETLDYSPQYASISPSGNRILIQRIIERDPAKKLIRSEYKVYNSSGNQLFTFPRTNMSLNSSPIGKFFYSEPGWDSYKPLNVLGEMGYLLFERNASIGGYWQAISLNDSLLIFLDDKELQIINVNSKETKKAFLLDRIISDRFKGLKIQCSKTGDEIAVFNEHQIYIFNKELELTDEIMIESVIRHLSFSVSNKYLIIVARDYYTIEHNIIMVKKEGEIIDQRKLIHPPGESWSRKDKYVCTDKYFIITYFSISGRRTFALKIDSDKQKIISQGIFMDWIYPFGDSGNFIEFGDKDITCWIRKGGE